MNSLNHPTRSSMCHTTSANHAVLSNRNVDRLKHEVSFHNPRNLSPDGMMNYILDLYFDLVEKIR